MKSVLILFFSITMYSITFGTAEYFEFTPVKPYSLKKDVLSKRMMRKLKRDAARLTLRISQEEEDLRYQDIDLDSDTYDEVFNVLKNIYTNTSEGQRLAKCKIHTYPDVPIDRFKIIFNKNIPWSENFKNGIFETPDDQLNALINSYDLVIDKYIQWNDGFDAVTVRSKKFLNIKALANEFFNIQGIEEIDYGIPSVKGNDINIVRKGQNFEVRFELALGSQMKSNDKHLWLFETKSNKIKFLKEDGPALPDYIKCVTPSPLFVSFQ